MARRGVCVGMAVVLATFSSGGATAQRRPAAKADLNGVWTNAWYTDLQRPKAFKGLVATPAEAEAYEAPRRALNGMLVETDDVLGQAASEFNDKGPGLLRFHGEIRTSWITDPADGRLPFTQAARAQLRIGQKPAEKYDNVEDRDTEERCLTARGAGAPILSSPDTNLVQIVQTPGDIVIVSEKNHDARVVLMGPPPPAWAPRGWMGVSLGRWRGKTLVVETTGRRPGLSNPGGLTLSDRGRVVEEFTRTGPEELTYRIYVEDTTLYARPWKGEVIFRPGGRMYEYACHEGNYSLPGILSAARQVEAAPATTSASAAARNGAP